MLMTIDELRTYVETNESDEVLGAKLQALELLIRGYTNNNFQIRAIRSEADIFDRKFLVGVNRYFKVGDTVQVTSSEFNNGLYTIAEVDGESFTVNEDTIDENVVLVTKVAYPTDVKLGVANLLKWEIENRGKVGISSETISRHSVTYFDMTGDNSLMGYPKALLGFLEHYKKARFGQGVRT